MHMKSQEYLQLIGLLHRMGFKKGRRKIGQDLRHFISRHWSNISYRQLIIMHMKTQSTSSLGSKRSSRSDFILIVHMCKAVILPCTQLQCVPSDVLDRQVPESAQSCSKQKSSFSHWKLLNYLQFLTVWFDFVNLHSRYLDIACLWVPFLNALLLNRAASSYGWIPGRMPCFWSIYKKQEPVGIWYFFLVHILVVSVWRIKKPSQASISSWPRDSSSCLRRSRLDKQYLGTMLPVISLLTMESYLYYHGIIES